MKFAYALANLNPKSPKNVLRSQTRKAGGERDEEHRIRASCERADIGFCSFLPVKGCGCDKSGATGSRSVKKVLRKRNHDQNMRMAQA